ncbi:MAG: DinB family protein [Fimbriimonas sp.]
MTVHELLEQQLAESGAMLTRSFNGISEADADAKSHPLAMSARETAVHLTECYLAAQAELKGEKFAWGSYEPAATTLAEQLEACGQARSEAVAALLDADEEVAANLAFAYVVTHDHYHVGQMVTLRLSIDATWNYMSIYGE